MTLTPEPNEDVAARLLAGEINGDHPDVRRAVEEDPNFLARVETALATEDFIRASKGSDAPLDGISVSDDDRRLVTEIVDDASARDRHGGAFGMRSVRGGEGGYGKSGGRRLALIAVAAALFVAAGVALLRMGDKSGPSRPDRSGIDLRSDRSAEFQPTTPQQVDRLESLSIEGPLEAGFRVRFRLYDLDTPGVTVQSPDVEGNAWTLDASALERIADSTYLAWSFDVIDGKGAPVADGESTVTVTR